MFLKRLELFGFKSFAEKTKIDFEAGVTAIVGPNGCGKTNFVDAVKWVLGEQSVRSMRGSAMEDVIFHGTDDIPAVGFAEVSLTISNEQKLLPLDYEEVTLTRRIFRSGESEYLINKIPVRLKDISELLMGTGMGMHSYSLMEQGEVDQILSSKAEERRAIFEEAADITKYKSKKEEALRKLERTEENLQRIGDIIAEVKRQIKSMERQVSKAQRYKQEFEILKEHELKVGQYQYQQLKKEKRVLENKIHVEQQEETNLASQMNLLTQALEKIKQNLSQVEGSIATIQSENYEVFATIKTLNNKITLDKERIEELKKRRYHLDEQIAELAKKMVTTSEQVKDAQSQIEAIKQNQEAKKNLVVEKEEEITHTLNLVQEVQKKVTEDKMEEVEVITQQIRLRNELTKLGADLANFNARLRRLNVEAQRTTQDLNNLEEKQKICLDEFFSIDSQLKQLTHQLWDLRSGLGIKLERKQKLQRRLEELVRQITALDAKLNFLKEITQKYEGFSRGVKSILSALDNQTLKIDGLCGAVANLMEVLPQYQLAVEEALGENIQAIVVENRQAAYAAIHYLKEKDEGQANFICLDSQDLPKERVLRSLPNTLGRAQDFIKVEPKYQRVLEFLLANSFIVQNMEIASQILDETNSSIKLVTLKGEILTKASISGGSFSPNSDLSLLARQERISQTEAELGKLHQEKTELESLSIEQEKQEKEIVGLIQQKEPEADKLKILLANKESEKANIEAERKRFQDEMSVLKMEIEETNEQLNNLNQTQVDLNGRLGTVEEKQNELRLRIQDNQALITEEEKKRQNLLVEITQAKTQVLALEKEAEDAQTRLLMILDAASEQEKSQQAREQEAKDILIKIEQLSQEIEKLKSQDKELTQAQLNIGTEMNHALERRRRLSFAIQKLENKVRQSQRKLDEIRQTKANLQLKATELSYKQDSLKEKMQQSYQLDLEAYLEDTLEVSAPDETVFVEINRLKARLEEMGPINLVAIEENEQLEQRYSFLVAQQEDLHNAQESLRKAITQINRTARTMFLETFEKIQVSFREYFRILFGGGDARLVLLDENSILESGIEIVVRPPGKRLQNISLLSGGEKALTAIALLFAIFKVKPSPFCVLDEVDAPLDEANIDRFTNLLSEFVKTSQFIIITHNKRTINMADVMYGITMERSGVSKIVSVRLQDKQETVSKEVVEVKK